MAAEGANAVTWGVFPGKGGGAWGVEWMYSALNITMNITMGCTKVWWQGV